MSSIWLIGSPSWDYIRTQKGSEETREEINSGQQKWIKEEKDQENDG